MTSDQIVRFVITPLGIAALLWSFKRIRQDFRQTGGLPGIARKLGYAVGKRCRRFSRPSPR